MVRLIARAATGSPQMNLVEKRMQHLRYSETLAGIWQEVLELIE
jgi:hypothetical protein